nr:hypothetical protein [Rhodopseudomonas palustris]
MPAAIFEVKNTGARGVLKAEFSLVMLQVDLDNLVWVEGFGWWVDMKVVDWSRRSPMRRCHHEIVNLLLQCIAHQVTGWHHLDSLPAFPRHQMSGKGGPANSSRCAGDHLLKRLNNCSP